MYLFFILTPLCCSICIWILDLYVGKRLALIVISHAYICLIACAWYIYYNICLLGFSQYILVGNWIQISPLIVNWGFMYDSLSVSMLAMVTTIAGGVHMYSIGYMHQDQSIVRFTSYLSLFTFFMFLLVTSDNFIQLFLGWEGIGLCSYLLISFWNTRVQASKASLKALIVNRIGDFGFLCGVVLIFYYFRSLDFAIVFSLCPYLAECSYVFYNETFNCISSICFFLFIGAMGKSAQIGLHTWLPDAMEGPTPVSALIHAATLVTAGIFLIIRSSSLFELSSNVMVIVSLIGGVTAFVSATIAMAQYDIKKTIAYSTCSQLGYMVLIMGVSSYNASLFHLVNHAFFKALLFLSAGSIIHALYNDQDMRQYGALTNMIPYSFCGMFVGVIALSGLPFLAGFYSKDFILELVFAHYSVQGFFIYWLGTLSASLTAVYSFRIIFNTFLGSNRSFKYYIQNINELPYNMGLTLSVLIFGSIFSGYFLKESFVGVGSNFWGHSIFISSKTLQTSDFEFIPTGFKLLPLFLSILGLFVSMLLNRLLIIFQSSVSCFLIDSLVIFHSSSLGSRVLYSYLFLNHKWYFDFMYNFYINSWLLYHGYETCYKVIDKGLIEIYCSHKLTVALSFVSIKMSKNQSGFFYNIICIYILCIFLLWFILYFI